MKRIITISREFGSGGRAIGRIIAEQLGIPFYDKELLTVAAEKSNIHIDVAKDADETAKTGFANAITGALGQDGLGVNDRLFVQQSNLIKEIAETTGGVIVGRCADYILRDRDDVLKVFIHGDMENKIKRIMITEKVDEEEAKKLIEKTDKTRQAYYNHYSDTKWGAIDAFDISINSQIGIIQTAKVILTYLEQYK